MSSSRRSVIFVTSSLRLFGVHFEPQGIPDKGKALTRISLFWFEKLKHIVPNHLVTADIDQMPEEIRKYGNQLEGRSMLVKRAKVIPIEFIVRGYLTGERDVTIHYPLILGPCHRQVQHGRNTRNMVPCSGYLFPRTC